MVNLFAGIISPKMKQIHKDMIQAVIEDTGCTVPCRLIYGITRYNECPNCYYDSIGQRSTGRYKPGGPVPFQYGAKCSVCNGLGRIPVEETENLYLCVNWDYRTWINVDLNVHSPAGRVQTFCDAELTPKIKRCKEAIFATDVEKYAKHRFQRDSEPEPCGFGNDAFISTLWKRIG